MSTHRIEKRIENLEVRLKGSTSGAFVNPLLTMTPVELEEAIKACKETCRSAEERCGNFLHSHWPERTGQEEPTDIRLRAEFWIRRAVDASAKILMWENHRSHTGT